MKYRGVVSALALFLFALTACGGMGSTAPAGSITVHVTETDFHIRSSVTSFVVEKAYHFVVTNQGKSMHE